MKARILSRADRTGIRAVAAVMFGASIVIGLMVLSGELPVGRPFAALASASLLFSSFALSRINASIHRLRLRDAQLAALVGAAAAAAIVGGAHARSSLLVGFGLVSCCAELTRLLFVVSRPPRIR